ncbi:gamma-tubulin complex component 5-like protein [Tanacetum coccineum]
MNVDLRIQYRAAAGKFMLLLHKALANAEAFKKYNQVMNFLLQVKCAKFVLDEARRWVWKPALCNDGTVSANHAMCDKEVDRIKK